MNRRPGITIQLQGHCIEWHVRHRIRQIIDQLLDADSSETTGCELELTLLQDFASRCDFYALRAVAPFLNGHQEMEVRLQRVSEPLGFRLLSPHHGSLFIDLSGACIGCSGS